jgi:hypothetical protein
VPGGRACRLDCGYDSTVTRRLLDQRCFAAAIARYLAAALVTIRQLIERARQHDHWGHPACGEAAESGPCCREHLFEDFF